MCIVIEDLNTMSHQRMGTDDDLASCTDNDAIPDIDPQTDVDSATSLILQYSPHDGSRTDGYLVPLIKVDQTCGERKLHTWLDLPLSQKEPPHPRKPTSLFPAACGKHRGPHAGRLSEHKADGKRMVSYGIAIPLLRDFFVVVVVKPLVQPSTEGAHPWCRPQTPPRLLNPCSPRQDPRQTRHTRLLLIEPEVRVILDFVEHLKVEDIGIMVDIDPRVSECLTAEWLQLIHHRTGGSVHNRRRSMSQESIPGSEAEQPPHFIRWLRHHHSIEAFEEVLPIKRNRGDVGVLQQDLFDFQEVLSLVDFVIVHLPDIVPARLFDKSVALVVLRLPDPSDYFDLLLRIRKGSQNIHRSIATSSVRSRHGQRIEVRPLDDDDFEGKVIDGFQNLPQKGLAIEDDHAKAEPQRSVLLSYHPASHFFCPMEA